jgi:hypothetical protein
MALTTAALKRGCNTLSGNFSSGNSTMPAIKSIFETLIKNLQVIEIAQTLSALSQLLKGKW